MSEVRKLLAQNIIPPDIYHKLCMSYYGMRYDDIDLLRSYIWDYKQTVTVSKLNLKLSALPAEAQPGVILDLNELSIWHVETDWASGEDFTEPCLTIRSDPIKVNGIKLDDNRVLLAPCYLLVDSRLDNIVYVRLGKLVSIKV